MLLTITTTYTPATDLGYLLHKHPDRFQTFSLSLGVAHVFYPDSSAERCTACLLLEVDPVGLVRGNNADPGFLLGHYVNDRPYVASSLMSVAIAQVYGAALGGKCKDRPELVTTAIPFTARLDVLPVRGGPDFLRRIFEPLGYEMETQRFGLDEQFPEWGESPYYSVQLHKTTTLAELLTHLYLLIPVFDNQKHYYVGEDEMEKLLARGAGWLADHPERDVITRRYLKYQPSLYRQALERLIQEESPVEVSEIESSGEAVEDSLEQALSLNEQRHRAVVEVLRNCGARRVLDLGCGEGNLVRRLQQERQLDEIVGLDVSIRALEIARRRLKLDQPPTRPTARIQLLHGSLMYRDRRLEGYDAALVIEVIEHLDPPRLAAFERVLFACARPTTVILTTPNREYNVRWETLPAGKYRHPDHRFEWTRQEFQHWAQALAQRHGYAVQFLPVGPVDDHLGAPTQMGVFTPGEETA